MNNQRPLWMTARRYCSNACYIHYWAAYLCQRHLEFGVTFKTNTTHKWLNLLAHQIRHNTTECDENYECKRAVQNECLCATVPSLSHRAAWTHLWHIYSLNLYEMFAMWKAKFVFHALGEWKRRYTYRNHCDGIRAHCRGIHTLVHRTADPVVHPANGFSCFEPANIHCDWMTSVLHESRWDLKRCERCELTDKVRNNGPPLRNARWLGPNLRLSNQRLCRRCHQF